MIHSFTPEFRLAAACCRFPHDEATRHAVAEATTQISSWPRFQALIERHRIDGLVNIALAGQTGVPSEVRAELAIRARKYAALDLVLAAETARLQACFDEAGLPALFVKGAPVGMLAYHGLGIKRSWDIDLLTSPECVEAALGLLGRAGFNLVFPPALEKETLRRFVRFHHEAVLYNAQGVPVELHWRLSSKSHILPGVTARSPYQVVQLGGRRANTLCNDLLLPYLIAHGQEHGWSRLKWLADLHALLVQCEVEEIQRLRANAQKLGIGDSASAALLLCAQLFNLPLPEPPELADRRDFRRSVARLVRVDIACLTHSRGGTELPDVSRTNITLIASRIRLETGWRNMLSELATIWTQPFVRAQYPPYLDFAYHIFRVPLFVARLPLKLRNLRRTSRADRA